MIVIPDKSARTDPRFCPLNAFGNAVGGKYKMRIVWELKDGPQRYGELRRSSWVSSMEKQVTARVLSRELKELEKRGLIHREQYPVVPPKVEYSLTDLGASLIPVIEQIVHWGLTGGRAAVINTAAADRPKR
jgi:DNA-binding HxlR family transcriptional regulator